MALGLKTKCIGMCQLQVRFIWCLGITVRATCSSQVLLRGEIPFCEMVVRASTLHHEQPTCERRKKHYFAQRWTRLARTFLCGCYCQRVEVATWCPPLCLEGALSYFCSQRKRSCNLPDMTDTVPNLSKTVDATIELIGHHSKKRQKKTLHQHINI